MRDHRVIVVGAGIGGLVAALLLACRGLQVTLLEAAAAPGGKLRQLQAGGAVIDAGPTVFTMRWVFDEILAEAGSGLENADMLRLQRLDVLARHAWGGHDARLDLYADRERSTAAIGAFSGADEARRFVGFCDQAARVYRCLEGPYLRRGRPSLAGLSAALGPRGLATLAGLGPFSSLWSCLARHFRDPRLQQLFGRYATYCGASPFLAPATLMLIAQVEMDGVWAVDGGMQAVADAFAALARRRGVDIRCNQPVDRILLHAGRACGVALRDGSQLAADSVVFNGDTQALATGLLGDGLRAAARPLPRSRRSLSATTWAVHGRPHGFPLVRHNVFFDDDYASEFDDVFRRRRLPGKGTVYICAQDRADSGEPPGRSTLGADPPRERLLCLVNAPPDGDLNNAHDPDEVASCEHRTLTLLRRCGLTLTLEPQHLLRSTPADFNRLFPATGGALYGPASHGWTAIFKRPGATTPVPGLYLAGGSVHPGPGVPMAALSGRLAAAALMAHLGSISRSRRVATSGGISTPSVTTAPTR